MQSEDLSQICGSLEIADAEKLAKQHQLEKIVILGVKSGSNCTMVTWGNTKKACREAGQAGDFIKLYLNEHCGFAWRRDQLGDLPVEYIEKFNAELALKALDQAHLISLKRLAETASSALELENFRAKFLDWVERSNAE